MTPPTPSTPSGPKKRIKHYSSPSELEDSFAYVPDSEFRSLLASYRIKITSGRISVLKMLMKSKLPLTVADLVMELKKESEKTREENKNFRYLPDIFDPNSVSHEHFSKHARKQAEREVHAATVYRSLELFIKAGLVHCINVGKDRTYYEITFGRTHHHHIICTSCGDIEDVNSCFIMDQEETTKPAQVFGLKKFRRVESHSLEFFGICMSCTKK